MQTLYLSRLQHYLFCPRQFALIELECAWEENIFTAEGQVMHEKVNSGGHDTRGNIRTVRTLRLGHEALGLEGVADVVEYHTGEDGQQTPFPIEYKRGKPSFCILIKNLWMTNIFKRAITAFTRTISGLWRLPTFYNISTVVDSV